MLRNLTLGLKNLKNLSTTGLSRAFSADDRITVSIDGNDYEVSPHT